MGANQGRAQIAREKAGLLSVCLFICKPTSFSPHPTPSTLMKLWPTKGTWAHPRRHLCSQLWEASVFMMDDKDFHLQVSKRQPSQEIQGEVPELYSWDLSIPVNRDSQNLPIVIGFKGKKSLPVSEPL